MHHNLQRNIWNTFFSTTILRYCHHKILFYGVLFTVFLSIIHPSIAETKQPDNSKSPFKTIEYATIEKKKIARKSSIKNELSLDKLTVLAIDPGHGGIDPGATGKNGLIEKDITLLLAKKLRTRLSSIGNLLIALTRFDDTTINIESRNKIIEEAKADFVVSLHLNSIPQKHIALVESYYDNSKESLSKFNSFYIESNNSYRSISRSLAIWIQDSIFTTVQKYNKTSLDAGVKTNSMRILSQNKAIGALLEITCISNPEEEARLKTHAYLDELAEAVANGVRQFLYAYSKKTMPENSELLASQNLKD